LLTIGPSELREQDESVGSVNADLNPLFSGGVHKRGREFARAESHHQTHRGNLLMTPPESAAAADGLR
jgi:hypothetical protein